MFRHATRLFPICLTLLASLLVTACSGSNENNSGGGAGDEQNFLVTNTKDDYRAAPLSCRSSDLKNWVAYGMQDYYLFANQVNSNIKLSDYNSIEELIVDLRVSPDTFSYITDEQSQTNLFNEGESVGFGWVLMLSSADEILFKMVEPNSPMGLAGVNRGEQLVAINNIPALDFFRQPSDARDALISTADNSASALFTIKNVLGINRTINLTKSRYKVQTVLDTKVLRVNDSNVGYMNFYSFLNTSAKELEDAFNILGNANISDLVLDLRYNPGGRVSIANDLASSLVGPTSAGKVFVNYLANEKYQETRSTAISFINKSSSLNLSRLFVLQTKNTCSASELIVNGLRPFMQVITVGDASCGKPFASIPNTACGTVMNALEFESVNANGVGNYYNGIPADCPATDNVYQPLGSTSENLLATALNYMSTGVCTTVATRSLNADTEKELPAALKPKWYGTSIVQPEDLGLK